MMTMTSLVTAVTIGLVLGVLARWLVPACRRVPFWLPMAVGVGAAVFGTVTARLAGVDTSQVSPVEVILQVTLAGVCLGVVAATTERQDGRRGVAGHERLPSHGRPGEVGRPR
jgi:uncharacterized membrane protein YeaQ/YmgE (transglycosylase-associated protein family)